MPLPAKPVPENRPSRLGRVSWDKATIFAALALLLSLLIWQHRAPFVRVGSRLGVLSERLPYQALRQRIARQQSPAYRRLSALTYAADTLEAHPGDSGPARDRIALIREAARLDPGNAAFDLLMIDAALGASAPPTDPMSQFAAIEPSLRAAVGRRIDFGVTTDRKLWAAVIKEETGDDLEAVLAARRIVRPRHLARQRALHERMLSLSDRLVERGHPTEAAVCCAAVVSWAGAAIEHTSDIEEALFWADAAAEAHGRLGLLESHAARPAAATAARDAERRCRRFRNALIARLNAEPTDYVDRAGSGRTTARRGPYLAMMSYLIVSGITLAAAMAALATGAVALTLAAAFARTAPGHDVPAVTVRHGLWSWVGLGALLAAPCLLVSAAVLVVPIDPAQLGAHDWLKDLLVVAGIGTIAVVLVAGRLLAASVNPIRTGATFWRVLGTLALLGTVAVLLRQWAPFGEHPIWFERSWQTPASITRLRGLSALMVLLAVASAFWVLVRVCRWALGAKPPPAAAARRYATFKTVAVVSIFGWACCACLAAGSVRLYYRYEAAFRRLSAEDARDEVAARLGPRWWAAFFTDGDTLLRTHLSRLAGSTDE